MRHPRCVMVVVGAVLLIVAPIGAHEHPCAHTHIQPFPDDLINCQNAGADCEDGDNGAGMCKKIEEFSKAWCECVIPQGGDDGGCLAFSAQYFSDQGDGPPTQNTSIIYLAASDSRNRTTVSFANNGGVDFTSGDDPVQGTITLFFGSFTDPNQIPVTVEDVSLSLPDIGGQGVSYLELPDGAFQSLVYDSATGVINTVDTLGIELWLDNDFGQNQPVRVYLESRLELGGMVGLAQGEAPFPVFGNGFETGTTDDWSTVVGVLRAMLRWLGLTPTVSAPTDTRSTS